MSLDDQQQDTGALQEAVHEEPTSAPEVEVAPQAQNATDVAEDTTNWAPARSPSSTVRQDMEVTAPLDKPWDPSQMLLALPSDDAETIRAAIAARPNINIADTEQGGEWVNNIRAAEVSVTYGGLLNKATRRDGANFLQGVPSEKGILTAGTMRLRDKGDAMLKGERAVLRVRSILGMGSVIRVPLWHSGFWVSIKAPSDASLLELNRKLAEEKITLGRQTFGLAFANTSVFFAGWIMDFVLAHVYDSTLHPDVEPNIRNLIRAEDIPLLAWGLACVCWPGGFPYARAVLDPEQGEKVIKEKINIGKLLWVDNASLTPWQISHMSKIHGQTMGAADLERYRKEFTRGQGRELVINENLSFTLRSPTMDQYLNSGHKWVNNIVTMVDKAFSMPENDQVRDSYIFDQGKATNMRQYAHFIEAINVAGEQHTDEETIELLIDTLSSDKEIAKKYFDGIKAYIEDSVVAVVAIPATEREDKASLPRFPHLLVLDTLSVFFILLVQKIPQIQAR